MRGQAHFTPGEDIEPIVIGLIHRAAVSVRLQGYGFTSPGIAEALVERRKAKVDVQVILDGPNEFSAHSQCHVLEASGLPVVYDRSHAISHNKVIIIDTLIVVTGSYNWTEGARKSNAENIFIIEDKATAAAYLANWEKHFAHSGLRGTKKLMSDGDDDEDFGLTVGGYGDDEGIL